jgi:hypothetical protein
MIYIVDGQELYPKGSHKPDGVPTLRQMSQLNHLPRIGEIIELRQPGKYYELDPAYYIVTGVLHQLYSDYQEDHDIYIVVKSHETLQPR